MNLSDLSAKERDALAVKLGVKPKYLYQLAANSIDAKTGKPRRITAEMALKAIKFEPRLKLHELRPDVWAAPKPKKSKAEARGPGRPPEVMNPLYDGARAAERVEKKVDKLLTKLGA